MKDKVRLSGELEDINSEAHLWVDAVSQYLSGYPVPLASMLRDLGSPNVSADARALLADLLEGKLPKSKGGRPTERSGRTERAIASAYFAAYERQKAAATERKELPKTGQRHPSPADEACALVAKSKGIKPGAVRKLMERLGKGEHGITFDRWVSLGRPNW